MKDHYCKLALVLLVVVAVFFAGYKLSESPPTWMDEGIIIQSALNVGTSGVFGLQEAPGQYQGGSFLTTGYPVVYPVAGAFNVFGSSLFSTRLVMFVYIIFLLAGAYFLSYLINQRTFLLSVVTFGLIVSFAPLYGHGKNVLGEIPGTFFILLCLISLYQLELGGRKIWLVFSGLSLGLAIAAKPVFIPVIPAIAIAVLLLRLRQKIDWFNTFNFSLAVSLPLILMFLLQLSGETLSQIITFYSNPHSLNIWLTIKNNLQILFSQPEPLYTLGLIGLWSVTLGYRLSKRQTFYVGEWAAMFSAFFMILYFLVSTGYYRYLFFVQVLGLIYLPLNLFYWNRQINKSWVKTVTLVGLVFLILAQFYQLSFFSWTSNYYGSNRMDLLETYFTKSTTEFYYLYQVPEVAIFLPDTDYYQYLEITKIVAIGEETRSLLISAEPNILVVVPNSLDLESNMWLKDFVVVDEIDQYSILQKIELSQQ